MFLIIFGNVQSESEKTDSMCESTGSVRILWPNANLVQPVILEKIGVHVELGGLEPGITYHAYMHLLPHSVGTIYHEFTHSHGTNDTKLSFAMVQRIPDGDVRIKVQVFSSKGCTTGTADFQIHVSRDMGLKNPRCDSCFFTTGWASEHFAHWEAFFSANPAYPPMVKHPDILEVGSWEGMSAIWLSSRLSAKTVTCVDTWRGGPDQHGIFAETVLPGEFASR